MTKSQPSDPLRAAVEGMVNALGPWSEAGELLRKALEENLVGGDPDLLAQAMQVAHDMLTFKPQFESGMPSGFPSPTTVGEIELKRYPAHRLARTKMSAQDSSAFYRLLQHIQSNSIAMTVPVETVLPSATTPDPDPTAVATMAFLYGDDAPEVTQADPQVEVAHVAPMQVVSIGNRGTRSEERLDWARSRLEAWLASQKPDFAIVGPLRVLSYNSPSVPSADRYFEVQYPVSTT